MNSRMKEYLDTTQIEQVLLSGVETIENERGDSFGIVLLEGLDSKVTIPLICPADAASRIYVESENSPNFCNYEKPMFNEMHYELLSNVYNRRAVFRSIVDVVLTLEAKFDCLHMVTFTDGLYQCYLSFETKDKVLEYIEVRPTDGITIALMETIPMFVSSEVVKDVQAIFVNPRQNSKVGNDSDREFEFLTDEMLLKLRNMAADNDDYVEATFFRDMLLSRMEPLNKPLKKPNKSKNALKKGDSKTDKDKE